MQKNKILTGALFLIVFFPGCMAMHLQRLSNRQAKTVSEINEKQVLDNLATFVVDPNATPFFSVPGSSQNEIGANGEIGASDGAFRFANFDQFLGFINARSSTDANLSCTMTPTIDPNRLRLMQCAYKKAIGTVQQSCPDCVEIEKEWFGETYETNGSCSLSCGWVRSSRRWVDVPKSCRNRYGYHNGVYVWVDACDTAEFSKLVMLIVEYAVAEHLPPVSLKEVQFFLNEKNLPGTVTNHSTVVKAWVDSNKSIAEIQADLGMSGDLAKAKELNQIEEELAAIESLKNQNFAGIDWPRTRSLLSNSPSLKAPSLRKLLAETTPPTLNPANVNELEGMRNELLAQKEQLSRTHPPTVRPMQMQREFGPPTQYNSQFGGGILQLRQQLDAGRRSR